MYREADVLLTNQFAVWTLRGHDISLTMICLQDFCLLTGEFADKTSHLLDTLLM